MTSHWLKDCGSRFDSLKGVPLPEEIVDVVIIGAGMSGASTAFQLAQHGLTESVVLLEKNGISSGATGNNGGFMVPGLSEPYDVAVEKFGTETTRAMYEFSAHCSWYVIQFADEHKTDCELRMDGGVQLASTEEELKEMQDCFAKVSTMPFGGILQWWDAVQCQRMTGSRKYLGGIYRRSAGLLWAAKLVYGLVEEAVKLGVKVHTHTAVQSIYRGNHDGTISVLTDRGLVRTCKVVYCMNAWSRDLLPQLQDIIVPVRNQLIMTPPLPKMWKFGMSANNGYVYFMQRPDGRILIGGMRDKTPTKEVNNDDPTTLNAAMGRALREYLPQHFPQLIKYFTGQCCVDEKIDMDYEEIYASDFEDEDEVTRENEEVGMSGPDAASVPVATTDAPVTSVLNTRPDGNNNNNATGNDEASSTSVDSADAREYVVPSSTIAATTPSADSPSNAAHNTSTTSAAATPAAHSSSSAAQTAKPSASAKKTKAKPAPAKPIPLTPVESEWIGIMGFTPDRNPLVGPLDSSKLGSGTPSVATKISVAASLAVAKGTVGNTHIDTAAPTIDVSSTSTAAPVAATAPLSDTPLLNIDSFTGYVAYAINTQVVHPIVGMRLNNAHSEYIAAGYTGHGMPVAFLAGKNIADLICGVASDPPIPAAYSPSRYNL